jgi:sulfur carrier protein
MTITVNGQSHEAPPGSSVADLLGRLEIAAKHVAVEVNLEIVPRSQLAEHQLLAGDRVEVVTLVGGG